MTRTTTAASTSLFGLDIAGELAGAIADAGGVLAATLIKRTSRARATADLTNGTRITEERISCRAIRDEAGASGKRTATISLLGATILQDGARVVPEIGDAIEVLSERWEVTDAPTVDPATAIYDCPCARAGQGAR